MLHRIPDGSPSSIVEFVNVIEQCYSDLMLLKKQKEFSNPAIVQDIVQNIENKLPRDIAVRWYR